MNSLLRVMVAGLCSAAVCLNASAQTSWRDSLEVLNKAISQHPRSVDLRLRKAAVNIELNQWEYAIDEYGRVLQLEPGNLSALYFRAFACTHLQRYDQARSDYEDIVARVPRHFEAMLGLVLVKRKQGRMTEALDGLNTLVELFPDSALAYASRASMESEMHHYEPALFDWDEALRLSPGNVEFCVSKAHLLLTLGRKKEARRALQQAIDGGTPPSALKEWLDRCK